MNDLIADLRKVQVAERRDVRAKEGPFVEPVHLQVVCRRLWRERRNSATITRDHLTAVQTSGVEGVDGVLAEYYSERVATAAGPVG